MRVAEIVPAVYNPRVTLTEKDFEYQALKASIDEFGLVVPLIVNRQTGNLLQDVFMFLYPVPLVAYAAMFGYDKLLEIMRWSDDC